MIRDNSAHALDAIAKLTGQDIEDFADNFANRAKEIAVKDTGNMAGSISVTKYEGDTAVATGVEAECGYGAYVDLGTSKMAAQPFMRPAFDESVAAFDPRKG